MRLVLLIGVLTLIQASEPPVARVSGRVTAEPADAPLAGVLIRLLPDPTAPLPPGRMSPATNRRIVTTTSDKEGKYEFFNVPAGRYRLEPSIHGYIFVGDSQDSGSSGGKAIDVKPGQSSLAVDFLLSRTSSLTVRVTDDLGQPFGATRVFLEGADEVAVQTRNSVERVIAVQTGNAVQTVAVRAPPPPVSALGGMTDDTGEARLLEIAPGAYLAGADAFRGLTRIRVGSSQGAIALVPTYYPGVQRRQEASPLQIARGQEVSIEIRLQTTRLWRIRGTILSSKNAPHPWAVVTLFPAASVETPAAALTMGATVRQVHAEKDGRFEFTDISPGVYRVAAASGYRDIESGNVVVSLQDRDSEVRIATAPEATPRESQAPLSAAVPPVTALAVRSTPAPRRGEAAIRGRVLAAGAEAPLQRALVSLGTSRTLFSEATEVLTDDDGRYEFAGLTAGPYIIRARKSGFAISTYGATEATQEPEVIRLASSDQRQDVDIRLQAGSAVVVSVVNAEGAPVRSARVQISKKGEAQERMTVADPPNRTDDRGRLRVGGLPPGTYYVGAIDDASNAFSMMVYFPSTMLFSEAQSLVMSGGQEAHVTVTLHK